MATVNASSTTRFSSCVGSISGHSSPYNTSTVSLYLPAKPSFASSASSRFPLLPPLSSPKPPGGRGAARRYRRLRSLTTVSVLKKLSESESVSVSAVAETADDILAGNLPSGAGVYAVYDRNDELQFVGISRNVAASILAHRKSVPELCSAVKVGVVDEQHRAALTQAWKSWMEEHIGLTGKVPLGNEKGNTTWIQAPPQPKKKLDLRITPGRHVQLNMPLEQLIDRLVKENKVVAFIKGSRSAPLCGFSQRVIGILESQGVDYESVDVLDKEYNYGLREKLKEYSNWPTFPQVFVNGELVGGSDILTSMYEQGKLGNLLKG